MDHGGFMHAVEFHGVDLEAVEIGRRCGGEPLAGAKHARARTLAPSGDCAEHGVAERGAGAGDPDAEGVEDECLCRVDGGRGEVRVGERVVGETAGDLGHG